MVLRFCGTAGVKLIPCEFAVNPPQCSCSCYVCLFHYFIFLLGTWSWSATHGSNPTYYLLSSLVLTPLLSSCRCEFRILRQVLATTSHSHYTCKAPRIFHGNAWWCLNWSGFGIYLRQCVGRLKLWYVFGTPVNICCNASVRDSVQPHLGCRTLNMYMSLAYDTQSDMPTMCMHIHHVRHMCMRIPWMNMEVVAKRTRRQV